MLALLTVLLLSSVTEPPPESAGVRLLQYRRLLRDQLGNRGAFQPSCSHYAEEALSGLGFIPGFIVAIERWTRCHRGVSRTGREILPDGRVYDPLVLEGEVRCWGAFLLPF